MKKLKALDAACAVLALHYVSGVEENTALRVCTMSGFHPGEGMSDEEWKEAAGLLGLAVRAVPLEPCRLKTFMTAHPTGLFLVSTFNHLFVLDNGLLIDPRAKTPGLGRVVRHAWRVSKL